MDVLSAHRTALYDWHARQGARFVAFGGWDMPVQYTGILQEHRAVRTAAGLFDVSHMGEALVYGPDAARALDHVMTNAISTIAVGRARYTFMCSEDGGVIDDVIVYRKAHDMFFICLNAANTGKDIAYLGAALSGKCTLMDVSAQWGQLAVQGPRALEIVQQLTATALAQIPRFGFAEGTCAGEAVVFSRTGYTGEDGFEIYVPAEASERLADALLVAGTPLGLLPAGLGARDSLRLEAGYPLYGHEISQTITPIQAGLDWAVKFDKPEFIGKAALLAESMRKPEHRVCFFTLDDRRIARQGMDVFCENELVGTVCSGTLSPMSNQPIGSAWVRASTLEKPLMVAVRGQKIPMRLKRPPLHL